MRELPSRSGDDGEMVTPVPIPNTEVKHFCGEDSYTSYSKNSTSPGLKLLYGVFFICMIIKKADYSALDNSMAILAANSALLKTKALLAPTLLPLVEVCKTLNK